ncbi:type VI secretion system accessory protein TagJ [Phyllobacterium myrsinacearum]|uniref:Nitrogen fixation protein n=1 Tax=Phyllobacterium myrsinacearum TaxID=28101 RepID=A0A2S9JAQ0_9HYPH|nr:type VI secretion system accessory protein TagJ [Phyllobacterium myrsinacearum]PRD49880.1 nitrogen fixation protein [Phyllobacterium myrsinacearum]PWV83410.1 type VI secretion system protein ImpE [Phyllobacterium myrsinacearum]RZS76769.1 type VI secretion system protein ImpE [Phyllobacterium myrsinacearum]RZU97037.1 type VI secretion system protein ImpE [Phyllobacterium myrsinacearum]
MTNATGSVSALIDAGDLQGAVSAALSVVKQRPTDGAARRRLIDLLIVSGDFERADKQADILSKTIPDMMVGLALLRGRLRAADARAAWFETGAVPAFPDGPSANDQLAMKNALAIGGGHAGIKGVAATAFPENVIGGSVKVDGRSAASFRDLDDRIPHAVEILHTNGTYMWIDFNRINRIEFQPVRSLRDLTWRHALLTLRDDSQSEIIMPATYFTRDGSDAMKLGRTTDWTEAGGGLFAGKGQKCLLVDDDVVGLLDVTSIEFLHGPAN